MGIVKIEVYRFSVSEDLDDPYIQASKIIKDWNQSAVGQWVKENAVEPPTWEKSLNYLTYNSWYRVCAKFAEKKLTEYYLRFGK